MVDSVTEHHNFCCAMPCISAVCVVMWCLSVAFGCCVKMSNHIFRIFSLSGSHTILVNIPSGTPNWRRIDQYLPLESGIQVTDAVSSTILTVICCTK